MLGGATGDWNEGGDSAAAGDWNDGVENSAVATTECNGGGKVTTNGNHDGGDDHGATNGAVAVNGEKDHSGTECRR